MSDWRIRQREREVNLALLEDEAKYVHDKLMELWHSEQHDSKLLDRDLELREEIKTASRKLEACKQADPDRGQPSRYEDDN